MPVLHAGDRAARAHRVRGRRAHGSGEGCRHSRFPDRTGVRSFLGICGYYRHFIRNFAEISSPLSALTSEKVKFERTEEAQSAFEELKQALVDALVLAYPDFDKPFVVETDASGRGVGAVLAQKKDDGHVHPTNFASRSLNSAERNYFACEREALVVIFAIRKFRVYLLSDIPFDLVTDHQSLRYAFEKKDVHSRLARWLDFLAEYDYNMKYKPGSTNSAADFLPRDAAMSPPIGLDEDEGEVAIVAFEADAGLEPVLVDLRRFLLGMPLLEKDPKARRAVRRLSKSFIVWNHQLFHRTPLGPKLVIPKDLRRQVLETFHDRIGHWDSERSRQFIVARY